MAALVSRVVRVRPGQPVRGMVLGEVVESRAPTLAQGDVVSGFGSWSDYVVAPGGQWRRAVGSAPNPDLLHRRGSIGLTAYYGLTRIAGIRPGDRVLVSGAAVRWRGKWRACWAPARSWA